MPRRRRSDKDDLKPVYENAVGFDITPEVWGALTQMDTPSMLRVSTWLRDVCKRNRQHGQHVGVQSATVKSLDVLEKLAAWDDTAATDRMKSPDDYTPFDEPGAVSLARETLRSIYGSDYHGKGR